jgi:hypothetical protein
MKTVCSSGARCLYCAVFAKARVTLLYVSRLMKSVCIKISCILMRSFFFSFQYLTCFFFFFNSVRLRTTGSRNLPNRGSCERDNEHFSSHGFGHNRCFGPRQHSDFWFWRPQDSGHILLLDGSGSHEDSWNLVIIYNYSVRTSQETLHLHCKAQPVNAV